MTPADLLHRVRGILADPRGEWPRIAAEAGDLRSLAVPYVVGLAGVLPVAHLVAVALIGESHVVPGQSVTCRTPIAGALPMALLLYGALVGAWMLLGRLIALLAPTFQARHDEEAAHKLATYALTPVWLAGAFALVATLHASLSVLFMAVMAGGLGASWYLLTLGLPHVVATPPARAPVHAALALGATAILAGAAIRLLHAIFGPLLIGSVLPPA